MDLLFKLYNSELDIECDNSLRFLVLSKKLRALSGFGKLLKDSGIVYRILKAFMVGVMSQRRKEKTLQLATIFVLPFFVRAT